jgi:hypothetical protein
MYSKYAALFRDTYWGGIPVSLFALGAFAFFAGYALYLLWARERASKHAIWFFAAVSVTPLIVSIGMFVVSLVELGTLCKTCVGIYIASILVAVGGLLGLWSLRSAPAADAMGIEPRPTSNPALAAVWLVALGIATMVPAVAYAAIVPDHSPYVGACGKLARAPEEHHQLVRMRTGRSTQPALFLEDPLCPTCAAVHHRLASEGILQNLDVQVALFPLDNTCNWMLDAAMHPGACLLSKAILCGGAQSQQVLEWAFDEQRYLTRAGKQGDPTLRAVIKERWGAAMLTCIDSRETEIRLNKHLHFAAENNVPVSTPQLYLGQQRICDEDTDIGLRFTFSRLAPEVLR